MLRKIKTNLTKADLQKPALNIDDAVTSDAGTSSSAGALFLPEDQGISQALASAPVVEVSNDWMKKGDPNAPALKELEERARQEREAAALAAQAAEVVAQEGGGLSVNQDAVLPVPQPSAEDASYEPPSTARFPWTSTPNIPAAQPTNEVDEFAADMGVAFGQSAGSGQPQSTAVPVPMAVTYSDEPGAHYEANPMVMPEPAQADEMVLHIPHDIAEMSANIAASQNTATIVGDNKPDNGFAGGGAVHIQHDSPLESLPYTPKNHNDQKTSNGF